MKKFVCAFLIVCLGALPLHGTLETGTSNGKNPIHLSIAQAQTATGATPTVKPICNSAGYCSYTPLEPLPGTTNPFDGAAVDFPQYLNAIFRLLITLGALFAVVMLVISGIRYMLSESFTDKEKAVKRIQSSIWGLLLLASSWLILYTINPQLKDFAFLRDIKKPAASSASGPSTSTPPPAAAPAGPYTLSGQDGTEALSWARDNSYLGVVQDREGNVIGFRGTTNITTDQKTKLEGACNDTGQAVGTGYKVIPVCTSGSSECLYVCGVVEAP